jgi:FkbM family methyltransferase
VRLSDKYQVASFQDVFCHPFYWHALDTLQSAPRLVIDCGAHCGHFSILADLCIRSKFGGTSTQFILVEPNKKLLKSICANIKRAGMGARTKIIWGLVGKTNGSGPLWINKSNFLTSSITPSDGSRAIVTPYVDLAAHVNGRPVDLLKVDIEGAELEFCRFNPGILQMTNTLIMEIHGSAEANHDLVPILSDSGLSLYEPPVQAIGTNKLAIFVRS